MNATQMAKPFGKRPIDWLKYQNSQEFIAALCEVRKITSADLVTVIKGGNGEQGTWMHEDVALEFARWLSPKFAIWCNDRIKELLSQRPQAEAAPRLPLPVSGTASLVEAVAGKAVTTSRKLAQVLGRDHSSILDTIKNNQHRREFKYGHFTTRDYVSGLTGHGYEFLITRRGLDALASVMRYGAKDKIEQAYDGAWDTPKAVVPAGRAIPVACAEEVEYLTENTLRRIERLEQCVDNLAAMNKQAYDRVSMYDGLYQEEKEAKEKAERDKGVWYDLYADLMWRVVKGTDGTPEKRMERHQAFKDRLLKSIRRRIITE